MSQLFCSKCGKKIVDSSYKKWHEERCCWNGTAQECRICGAEYINLFRLSIHVDRRHTHQYPPPFVGKYHTEETKRRICESLLGKPFSEERKRNISKGLTNNPKVIAARAKHIEAYENSDIELAMQEALWLVGIDFNMQEPILGIPDLYLPDFKLCIFCDGDYSHAYQGRYKAEDIIYGAFAQHRWDRDRYVTVNLENQGYTVLRFWGHEIKEDIPSCVAKILTAMV